MAEERQDLTKELIIKWAKLHYERNNEWPSTRSEMISEVDESRKNIDECLKTGGRRLEGGSSLSQLSIEHDLEGYKSSYIAPRATDEVQETIEEEEGETPIDGKFINSWAVGLAVFSFGFLCIGSFLLGATATTSILRGVGGAIIFGALIWLAGTMFTQEENPK